MAGELSTPVTRLYVVTLVAWTVLAILALILICNIFLLIYAQRNTSILLKSRQDFWAMRHFYILMIMLPISWPSSAEFRRDHPEEHKLLDFVNENYTVKTPTCRMEEASKRIRIENLDMLE